MAIRGRLLTYAGQALAACAIFVGGASACSLFQPPPPPAVYQEPPAKDYRKPWKTTPEKKRVMVTIATRLLQDKQNPVKDACISKVLARLHNPGHAKSTPEHRDPKCEQVMKKCGACHLPRVNTCNYRVTWNDGKKRRMDYMVMEKRERNALRMMRVYSQVLLHVKLDKQGVGTWKLLSGEQIHGKLLGKDGQHIKFRTASGIRRIHISQLTRWYRDKPYDFFMRKDEMIQGIPHVIPIAKIERIEWLNGGDPLETWWDFKSLSPRGEKARRMFDIAARHRVGCTNCHVGHGDFQLTHEGRVFQESGRVIRRVPLDDFLRGK